MALNIPIAIQEMVFAVWLIWKGFNVPPVSAASTVQRESLVAVAGRS